MSKSKLIVYGLSLLIILVLTSCNPSSDAVNTGAISIDPTFSDFYKELGGTSMLGPAISPAFINRGITYQYVVSGLMAYDPNQITLTRFHFSPIATTEWGVDDLIEPTPSDPSSAYLNGHQIWEEVLTFYNRYGSEIIGLPVTSVKANDEMQRYEQYFEGLGFFRKYDDPPGKIQLLPYGSWMCGENCQNQNLEGIPDGSYKRNYSETEQLFLQEAERLGYEFTGNPLASPEIADDGNIEMVFENMVMFIDPLHGSAIKLRPLSAWLGIHSEPPVKEIKADWLSFYQQGEGTGYNVPNTFADYISKHGGMEIAGFPITEYQLFRDGGYSQCYTNLCLEYRPNAPHALITRPHSLGIEYKNNGVAPSATDSPSIDAIQLNVWEEYPLIPSGQRQIINITAAQNGSPMSNIKLSLIVKDPDGIVKNYAVNPTGSMGETSVELDPINGPNGAEIQYEVCVIEVITPQVCFVRRYTIWNQ